MINGLTIAVFVGILLGIGITMIKEHEGNGR